VLLDGLEAPYLSAQAKQRREELRRKLGIDIPPPKPIHAGFVSSPIPSPAAAKMTDRQWLRAIEKYDTEERRDWLQGGPHELASVLQVEARNDPRRFARLAIRLPDDVNGAYPSAILIGIGDSAEASHAHDVFDAIRRIHALPGRPVGRWIGRPLARLANADIPDDVIAILKWYALEDPDPASDLWLSSSNEQAYYGGDPLTAGINSVRGAAAEAISALVWPRAERVREFADALRRLCNDPVAAVRSCAALAVMSVSRHEEAFGLELLKTLVNDVDDRILATHTVERCLTHFGRNVRSGLTPVTRRMIASQFD
jgi:hypothetical protein